MQRADNRPTDYDLPEGWEAGGGGGGGHYTHNFAYYDDENAEYYDLEVYSDGEAGGNDHIAILRAVRRQPNGDVTGEDRKASATINADDVGGHDNAERLVHARALDMMHDVTEGEYDYPFEPWWEQCDHEPVSSSDVDLRHYDYDHNYVVLSFKCAKCESRVEQTHDLAEPVEEDVDRPAEPPF